MALTYSNINIVPEGGGGSTPPFSSTFSIGSWTLLVTDYFINIPESSHNFGTDTQVQVFELVGSDYIEVETEILINPTGDVKININQTPDTRFAGKIVIVGA